MLIIFYKTDDTLQDKCCFAKQEYPGKSVRAKMEAVRLDLKP